MPNPFNQFSEGYAQGQGMAQDFATQRAGNALAQGNYGGAAKALYGSGQLQDGNTVQGWGEDRQDAQAKAQKAQAAEKLTFLKDAASNLARIPEQGRRQALSGMGQMFQSLGIPAEAIQQLGNADLSDQALQMFVGQVDKELEFAKASDGSYSAIDKSTGRPVYQYQAPTPDKYEQYDPEKELRVIPGRPGGPMQSDGPQAAPQPSNWLNGVSQAAPDAQVTSGYRSPADNARVRGAANSRHLTGEAVDLVPRPGETMAQLFARVNKVPGARAIDESNRPGYRPHIHVEKAGDPSQPAGAPQLVRPAQPKPSAEQWVQLPDGRQRNTRTGKIEGAVTGGANGAKTTEGERTAGFLSSRLADSLANLSNIAQTAPDAAKPKLGETLAGMFGTEAANASRGTDRQQVVANQLDILDAALTLGTGAAYTREQLENYQDTYFPKLTDKPETVTAKQRKLLNLLRSAQIKAGGAAPPALATAIASAERQFGAGSQPAQPRQPGAQAATGSPPPAALKAGQITTFANGQRWTLADGKAKRVQ